MNQATFNFAPRGKRADIAAARRPVRGQASQVRGDEAVDPGDVLGFDYARFGMVPPAPCLWPGHPIREGWERGRRLMTRRTRPRAAGMKLATSERRSRQIPRIRRCVRRYHRSARATESHA